MPRLPVLSYFPIQPNHSPKRTVARTILAIVVFGMASFLILAFMVGDIDDWGWLFFSIGAVLGAALALFTRYRFIPRTLTRPIAFTFFGIGSALDLAAIVSIPLGRDILTGTKLDEMDALIPVVWMIASIVPFSLAALCLLVSAPNPCIDHVKEES
jgi:hypothetical protein